MNNYLKKFIGKKEKILDNSTFKDILFAFIGSFIAITIIGYLTKNYNNLLVMGSFGASCVLLFGFPKSPFSQPRNVIFGHFISSLTGLSFLHFVGNDYISMALALATAIALMMTTKTVHPPAGSNPLIIFLLGVNWDYLIFPTLVGSVVLVIVSLFYNNLHKNRIYPQYWF
ncbi:HPP family protein [Aliarcobacter butzleri]|uniref:Membrane protein n=1 Tax=Aliarcobacter butzleri L351 TaxID=1447259 RepID=A0A837J761_9BACT|nr:HPP family protein [Aliarcobacter butzleri]KLE01943.1 membrane protein [Aliarcobacter butzleri L351]KLE13048.1 membrane protein [Aliarcobacter butzleri L350]MDN5055510.1 HPP family protein [Aliarcobacter butzleri]MDN5059932.1 HPP family protein [Aliarcobacter butzleri]MDN5110487.1 HPP family protein [Aliarcobacter butzleri]